jgi:palmitoyltransferase
MWVNNCIGQGNYKYFLALLLSTTVILGYAAYLAYLTLEPEVKEHLVRGTRQHVNYDILHWIDGLNTAILVGGIRRGAIGLLALLTAPLSAGLLFYHAYLIYAGMTTGECSKWNRWRQEIANESVYIVPVVVERLEITESLWPKRSRQFLVVTTDGLPPRNLPPEVTAVVGEHAEWRRCLSLKEVDNTYNLGLWRNLCEILLN